MTPFAHPGSGNAHPALEATDLSKQYGRERVALRNVNLSLEPGGIVGLVGPNGAGKSTLLKLWVGFERASQGSVLVFGADPWRQRREVLSRVAYLPQTPALYRDLQVADHLAFVAHYRPEFDKPRAVQRLDDLRIPLAARAGSLSGGQVAQVGLAIALGLRPTVLLLDEPLASLDPLARREFIDVLASDVDSTGATAILSSHVVSDVERACSRLIVLGAGEIQLAGRIDDILASHIVQSNGASAGDVVATLPGGSMLCRGTADVLTRGPAADAATLDDVVLGYLIAGRGDS